MSLEANSANKADFSALEEALGGQQAPELFYLPRPAMQKFSDATIVLADGTRLPVHASVLALASPVLCEAFAGQAEGDVAVQGPTELTAAFEDFSLQEVALFLRLAYCPNEATSSNLSQVHALLPRLLRLAHQLQADNLVDSVVQHATASDKPASVELLVGISNAADACQLDDLQQQVLDKLIDHFVASSSIPSASVLLAAAQLSKESLALLLGAAATSQQPRKDGAFVCELTSFSTWTEKMVCSPTFYACGARWRLAVWPNGHHLAVGKYLSIFLQCMSVCRLPLKVACTLDIRAPDGSNTASRSVNQNFTQENPAWGADNFISLERLNDPQLGYLQGDKLTVAVKFTVASEKKS